MKRIDKSSTNRLSTKYKAWEEKLEKDGKEHPPTYRYYYTDVVMDLYRCQKGICAYTEMHICIPELWSETQWTKGRHKIEKPEEIRSNDHFGELEHWDATLKSSKYWLWDNLFMIHSSINSLKRNKPIVAYLKPDLPDYDPEKYFEYDDQTHRYVVHSDIENPEIRKEIQIMIDEVLYLNHGKVRMERKEFIESLRFKRGHGQNPVVDRFFTAVKFCLGETS